MPNIIYHTPNLTTEQQELMSQYRDICEGARNREIVGYVERHHILPECMGGIGPLEDKVPLTAQEHFNVHYLLMNIFVDDGKLVMGCHRMMHDKRGREINADQYAEIRIKHANAMREVLTGRTKEEFEYLARHSELMLGRNKETNSGCLAISIALTGRNKHTHPYLAENGIKIGNANRGKTAITCEGIARRTEVLKAQNKFNNEIIAANARNKSILTFEDEVLIYELRVKKVPYTEIYEILANKGYVIGKSTVRRMYSKMVKYYEFKNQ